jgi:hypothetical protein
MAVGCERKSEAIHWEGDDSSNPLFLHEQEQRHAPTQISSPATAARRGLGLGKSRARRGRAGEEGVRAAQAQAQNLWASLTDSICRLLFPLSYQLLQKIWMAAFVNETEEVNRVTLHLIIDVIGKWLCSAAGKTVWPNMVTAAPPNDFTRLSGNAFVKGTGQSLGYFPIPSFFACQVIAKEPAENRLHGGRPKTS